MPAVRKKCPHTREKDFYQECGGASICEHDRRRSTCKSCGGSAICEHSRVRSSCKVCGGSSICEHSYIRSRCTICGGGSIGEGTIAKSASARSAAARPSANTCAASTAARTVLLRPQALPDVKRRGQDRSMQASTEPKTLNSSFLFLSLLDVHLPSNCDYEAEHENDVVLAPRFRAAKRRGAGRHLAGAEGSRDAYPLAARRSVQARAMLEMRTLMREQRPSRRWQARGGISRPALFYISLLLFCSCFFAPHQS